MSNKTKLYNGDIFEGSLINGEPEGEGKLWTKGGSYYEGHFKNGEFDGIGKMEYEDGDVYEGERKKGERNGKGKMVQCSGWTYEGERKKGLMCGHGSEYNGTCLIYEGKWENNEKNGYGKVFYDDHYYAGYFENGKRVLKGDFEYVFNNGDVIEGTYKNGEGLGSGIIHESDGSVYEGEFSGTTSHGSGKMIYNNGDIYRGNMEYGSPKGYGKMEYFNGSSYEGFWGYGIWREYHVEEGSFKGEGKLTFGDGTIFDGQWEIIIHDESFLDKYYEEHISWKEERLGSGKVTLPNGDTFDAERRQSNLDGYDVYDKEYREYDITTIEDDSTADNMSGSITIFFFDTETTGLSESSQIIQFGGILGDLDLDNGEFQETDRISQYINCSVDIEESAYQTHHISKDMLKKYQYMDYYIDKILRYFSHADLIVGHNVEFDLNMMKKECNRLNIDFDWSNIRYYDTMKGTVDLVKIRKSNGYPGYKWPKLNELYQFLFNSDVVNAHDALADIEATKDCFLELERRYTIHCHEFN